MFEKLRTIIYPHTSEIPSNYANVTQVLKTCAAFENSGIRTYLVAPKAPGHIKGDLSKWFGARIDFETWLFRKISIPAWAMLMGFFCGIVLLFRKGGVLYTRIPGVARGASYLNVKIVLELHVTYDNLSARQQRHFKQLMATNSLLGVVVITNALKRAYSRDYESLNDKILVAHSGADDPGEIEGLPTGDVFTGKVFTVGYVGHLYPGKGMEIIAQLAHLCPHFSFEVVGGHKEDLEYWKHKTSDLDNIKYAGFLPPGEARKRILDFDVVIAPYLRVIKGAGGEDIAEGISPLKIFEYMSMSKPILASSLPTILEVLEDKVDAMLCDPDNIDDWVRALDLLASNTEIRMVLGKNAKEKFTKSYTSKARAQRILGFIDISLQD